jgi:hypothetical protein
LRDLEDQKLLKLQINDATNLTMPRYGSKHTYQAQNQLGEYQNKLGIREMAQTRANLKDMEAQVAPSK